MVYKYKALSSGTLNDPYRYIEEGAVIKSPVEIKASWLKPFDTVEPVIPVLPVTSSVNYAGSQVTAITVPPTPIPDAYKAQMEKVIELEAAQDAALGNGSVEATASVETSADASAEAPSEGTGNQDVI